MAAALGVALGELGPILRQEPAVNAHIVGGLGADVVVEHPVDQSVERQPGLLIGEDGDAETELGDHRQPRDVPREPARMRQHLSSAIVARLHA